MVSSPNASEIFEFSDFRLIPEENLLLRNGEPLNLPPKALAVLILLVRRNGHLVSRAEIIESVWENTFVEEAAISKAIWTIRQTLNDNSTVSEFVQTVPKGGYRFVAPLRFPDTSQPELVSSGYRLPYSRTDEQGVQENQKTPSEVQNSEGSTPKSRKKLLLWVALGATSLAVLVWSLAMSKNGNLLRIESLAVLPLENLSGDPSQDYFAEGMTDALISDLAKIGDLRVRSRPSVTKYDRHGKSMATIGNDLGVDAVVTGSVSRSGDQIRISIQVTNAASDTNLWSKTYERNVSEVLVLQSEIARAVAGEIRARLTPQEQSSLSGVRPINPEAWDNYRRGKFYLNRQNTKDQDIAIASLEKATELDPTYALAFAELSQAYTWKAFSFVPDLTLAEKASIAMERSLTLNPNLAAGYLARGRVSWTPANIFPHERAIKDYRHAIDLDPELAEARNQLSLVYCHIGALDEALNQANEAVRIDPINNLLYLRIGQTLNFQMRYDEAYKVLDAIPKETHPSVVGMQTAWALLNIGKMDEADAMLNQLLANHEDRGGTFRSVKAVIAAYRNQPREAESLIQQAIEKGKGFGHFHHTAYTIACAYSLMKRIDKAVEWLEVAADTGFPCYPLFEKDTYLDNLRHDGRFTAFLDKQKKDWEARKVSLGLH